MATDRTRIKGLTVEIGGDASDLDKELKTIEKQSKKSNNELREINELLKLDPTNTDLLAQKQKVLASAIEGASKKLETLKAAEKSAREQFEKGDIGEEQFRALQRETIRAENQLHKLEQKLADTEQAAKDLTRPTDDAADAVRDTGDAAGSAAKQTDDLADSLDDLKGKYQDARDAAKDAASDLGKIGAVGIAAGTAVVVPAAGKEDVLASMQAGSGATAAQMVFYEKSMDTLYSEGYGEDLDDIAATMATIRQLSNETRADALTNITRDAIMLRDTFGYEAQDAMKASKMLVDQFGLSYDSAFNLIAQATQKGLNRSGDLLDIINEYSVHFKGLGYDAESMLNVIESGSQNGAFSLDKIGDATKELGIRLRDTSDTTTDAYSRLLLDADEYRKRIAAGGEAARAASTEVITALLMVDDQVAQNEIGVALFGSMWEDLGKEAISSLTGVNGTMDITKDTMGEIRDIKYSTTSNEWKKLGRTLQTEFIIPMGEKALPTAKKLVSFLKTNLDSIIPIIKKITTLGASMYTGMKLGQMVGAVSKLVKTYKDLKTAAAAASSVMAATPWGAIGAAIGIVVGAVVNLARAEEEAEQAAREHLRELKAAADEQTAAYKESAKAAMDAAAVRRDTADAINDEYDKYEALVHELEDLVDAEGNVLKGNEDRVEFIRGTLSEAMGEEILLVDGQIQKYRDLKNTIADVLALKRGEAMASKMAGDYDSAVESLPNLQLEYEQANDKIREYEEKKSDEAELQREYDQHLMQMPELTSNNRAYLVTMKNEMEEWHSKRQEYLDKFKSYDEWFAEVGDVYANAQAARTAYDAAGATIDLYEDLTTALYSGSTDQILEATEKMATGMMTFAQGAAYTSLYEQATELYQAHADAVKMSGNKGSTYQQGQLSEMQELAETAIYEAYMAAQAQGAPQQILQSLQEMMDADKLLNQVAIERINSFSDSAAGRLIESFDRTSEAQAERLASKYEGSIVFNTTVAAEIIKDAVERSAQKNEEGLGRVQRAINEKEFSASVSVSTSALDIAMGRNAALVERGVF